MKCPKCSSPNIHQGQMGSMKCYACGYMESAKNPLEQKVERGEKLSPEQELDYLTDKPTPPPDSLASEPWKAPRKSIREALEFLRKRLANKEVSGAAYRIIDEEIAKYPVETRQVPPDWQAEAKKRNLIVATSADAHQIAVESYDAGHAFARGETLPDHLHAIVRADNERLNKENARLREALERILHLGNMAAQGHWDDTHVMKNIAYDALKGGGK